MSKLTIKKKVIGQIYGNGRGWAFSNKDFASIGVRSTIDWILYELNRNRIIRRVIRGIFDYPRFSKNLNQELGPDIDQVARALARKFNWSIEPSGPAALNILGLSTQVPGKYLYHSSGPNRSYTIGKNELSFRSSPTKEIGFKYHESAIIVRALKSLGKEQIDNDTITKIRSWLKPAIRPKVLKDTDKVTGWVYESIQRVCREGSNG